MATPAAMLLLDVLALVGKDEDESEVRVDGAMVAAVLLGVTHATVQLTCFMNSQLHVPMILRLGRVIDMNCLSYVCQGDSWCSLATSSVLLL